MYDIIIIGAGTAGLTAALYALRANRKILVIESKNYGGQIINASKIENYPGIESITGFDYATNLYNQVEKLGLNIKYETVLNVTKEKTVTTNKGAYNAKSIIIATGASNRKLKIKDEDKYIGKGISYCATCDGNFFKDKNVAIVGGGNSALEDAVYLSEIAAKVYVIHRRDEFRGDANYLNILKEKDNVSFVYNSIIDSLMGDDKLSSINIKNVVDGSISNLKIDGLFVAIGQEPKNEIFANIINLDKYGYIETFEDIKTNIDGIYVCGDARVKILRQLTTAVGDGALAATTAIREMEK